MSRRVRSEATMKGAMPASRATPRRHPEAPRAKRREGAPPARVELAGTGGPPGRTRRGCRRARGTDGGQEEPRRTLTLHHLAAFLGQDHHGAVAAAEADPPRGDT